MEVFHSPGRSETVETKQAEYLNCNVKVQPDRSDAVSKGREKLLRKQKNVKKHKKTKKTNKNEKIHKKDKKLEKTKKKMFKR